MDFPKCSKLVFMLAPVRLHFSQLWPPATITYDKLVTSHTTDSGVQPELEPTARVSSPSPVSSPGSQLDPKTGVFTARTRGVYTITYSGSAVLEQGRGLEVKYKGV